MGQGCFKEQINETKLHYTFTDEIKEICWSYSCQKTVHCLLGHSTMSFVRLKPATAVHHQMLVVNGYTVPPEGTGFSSLTHFSPFFG
jgi:hypothetical protein